MKSRHGEEGKKERKKEETTAWLVHGVSCGVWVRTWRGMEEEGRIRRVAWKKRRKKTEKKKLLEIPKENTIPASSR